MTLKNYSRKTINSIIIAAGLLIGTSSCSTYSYTGKLPIESGETLVVPKSRQFLGIHTLIMRDSTGIGVKYRAKTNKHTQESILRSYKSYNKDGRTFKGKAYTKYNVLRKGADKQTAEEFSFAYEKYQREIIKTKHSAGYQFKEKVDNKEEKTIEEIILDIDTFLQKDTIQ